MRLYLSYDDRSNGWGMSWFKLINSIFTTHTCCASKNDQKCLILGTSRTEIVKPGWTSSVTVQYFPIGFPCGFEPEKFNGTESVVIITGGSAKKQLTDYRFTSWKTTIDRHSCAECSSNRFIMISDMYLACNYSYDFISRLYFPPYDLSDHILIQIWPFYPSS